MQKPTILLTGSTGFIGEYILGNLLNRGERLAILIRAKDQSEARGRMERSLVRLERSFGRPLPRPYCLVGDLHIEGLGLTSGDREWVAKNVTQVLHNAGSVDFHDRFGQSPRLTNVDGTQRLIAICQQAKVKRFHYVSTAYVCGDRRGIVLESELLGDQSFLSAYEESKYEAERLLQESDFEALTVYRPAAVVGDSRTGCTRSFHGIYWMARFTHLARERSGAVGNESFLHSVRLALNGNELHHFVPVDWVAESICHLLCNPQYHGKTYHLTSSTPITSALCEAALQKYFRYHGVTFSGADWKNRDSLNEVEQLFYENIEKRYWIGDPLFDCENANRALSQLPCPPVRVESLIRMFDFAVQCGFGKRLLDSQVVYSRPTHAC